MCSLTLFPSAVAVWIVVEEEEGRVGVENSEVEVVVVDGSCG